jgi:hypothetical protein
MTDPLTCTASPPTCTRPETDFFRCDFCASLAESHIHCHIPAYTLPYIDMWTPYDEYFVCSQVCGFKLAAFMQDCDLTHGVPYRIQCAHRPRTLIPPVAEQCKTCKTPNSDENELAWGDFEAFFCRNDQCWLAYCETNRWRNAKWALYWHVLPHGEFRFKWWFD